MSESGSRQEQRSAAHRVLGNGLEVSLASPPSRHDLALPDGRTSVVLQNSDRSEVETTVRFTDGRVLSTPAYAVGVRAADGDAPPDQLTLRRQGLSAADVESILRTAVADLGADSEAVDAYLTRMASIAPGDGDLIRSIRTEPDGDEQLVIEPVLTADESRASVNYLIRWEPQP